jgi:peptide/nickel transport system substrate-binding protein
MGFILLAGCGGSIPSASQGSPGASDAVDGASVTVAMADEPQAMDPQAKDDGFMRAVLANVFDALVDRAPDGEYIPVLAESWEQVDTTTWRFKLRPNVTFHNGAPFNADAVVFSVTRQIDPDFNSEILSYFTTIAGAEKVDDLTVDIKTNGFDPTLVGRMYWLRIVEPAKVAASTPEQLATEPVGTGPYKLDSWRRGQAIRLVVNEDYWGEAPAVTTMIFRPIKEGSSRLTALLAGEIDIATVLLPDQASQVPSAATTSGFEHGFIRLNAKPGSPTASKELRQAMNYAIDKEALAQQLFGGYAEVLTGQLVGPHVFGYNESLQAYPFDLAKARELVKASGYAGEELSLLTSAGRWPLTKEMAEAIVAMLGEAGINARVEVLEFGAWLDAIFALDNPPDMIHISETNEIGDPLRTIDNYYTTTGQLSSWPNADADALVAQAAQSDDQAERARLYSQVFELGRDDPVGIFLLNTHDIYGVSDRIAWAPRLDQFILGSEMTLK